MKILWTLFSLYSCFTWFCLAITWANEVQVGCERILLNTLDLKEKGVHFRQLYVAYYDSNSGEAPNIAIDMQTGSVSSHQGFSRSVQHFLAPTVSEFLNMEGHGFANLALIGGIDVLSKTNLPIILLVLDHDLPKILNINMTEKRSDLHKLFSDPLAISLNHYWELDDTNMNGLTLDEPASGIVWRQSSSWALLGDRNSLRKVVEFIQKRIQTHLQEAIRKNELESIYEAAQRELEGILMLESAEVWLSESPSFDRSYQLQEQLYVNTLLRYAILMIKNPAMRERLIVMHKANIANLFVNSSSAQDTSLPSDIEFNRLLDDYLADLDQMHALLVNHKTIEFIDFARNSKVLNDDYLRSYNTSQIRADIDHSLKMRALSRP